MPSKDVLKALKESYNRKNLKNTEDSSDMKYYIMCGKTGDIKFKTNNVDGYLSVWQAIGDDDYYVVIKP